MSTIHMKYKRLRFCRVSTSSQNYASFSSVHFLCTDLENFTWKMQEFLLICYVNSFPFQAEKTKPPEKDKTGVIPFLIKNITLPYAYTNYTIRVRLRSPFANKTEEFWSEPGILSIMTDSKSMQNACIYEHTIFFKMGSCLIFQFLLFKLVPDFPPETDLGSFESLRAAQDKRIIYVFWKSIPDHLKNGPNFHYEIDISENNGYAH